MSDPNSAPFQPQKITAALAGRGFGWIHTAEYFDAIDSTNDYLLACNGPLHGHLCITDFQTRGKGRRGKQWQAAKGSSLMFSLGWSPGDRLQAETSLIVGVALADALAELGVSGLGLKWPNDLMAGGRKLAGVLVETRLRGRQIEAVIGVGLNVCHRRGEMRRVERPWTDLAQQGLAEPDRQQLLLGILSHLARRLHQFEQTGFERVRADWLAYHAYNGREMSYQYQGERRVGRVEGLDEQGALLMRSGDRLVPVNSGEVSLLQEVT